MQMAKEERRLNRNQTAFNGEETQPLVPVILKCLSCGQTVDNGWQHAAESKHHSFMPVK